MEREIKPSAQTGKSTGYKVGLVFAILAGLVLVVLIGAVLLLFGQKCALAEGLDHTHGRVLQANRHESQLACLSGVRFLTVATV
jgi:hypothetical protein